MEKFKLVLKWIYSVFGVLSDLGRKEKKYFFFTGKALLKNEAVDFMKDFH